MTRMDESKGLSQPLATLPIKIWECPDEVRLIFGTWRFGLVQELNFRCEIRDIIFRSTPDSSKRATNTCIAPEKPLVIDSINNHELDSPGTSLVRTAPDIMNTRTEERARFPLTERPLNRKLSRMRSLDIPLTENSTNFQLITSQNHHINVFMIACLYPEKEVECPPA